MADWQLRSCQNPLEWVLYGLCDQKNLHNAFESGFEDETVDDDLFGLELYEQSELNQLSSKIVKLKAKIPSGPKRRASKAATKRAQGRLLSRLKESLGWEYPSGDVPLLPAKQSVTQMTHRDDEFVKMDYSRALERRPSAVLSGKLAERVDSQLIGTATHLVIRKLDLAGPINREAVERIKEELLADGCITEAVGGHIDAESILGFFESELGKIALDGENKVWCEWPFTFSMPAAEFGGSGDGKQIAGDELMVVQGIIDMLIQTPKGLVVIDFKTDSVSQEEVVSRAELYRRQLELYGRAASAILKARLAGKWLYFLTPGCEFEVK